jgi:peptide/nickel transport system substrate-binding protein
MENRFGIKDLILYALIVLLMIMVWLSMVQRDRQWERLVALQQAVDGQTRDLAAIRRQLSEGIALTSPATTRATDPSQDPFARLKAAEQMPGFARGDWLVDNFGTKVPKLTPLVSSDVYGTIVQNRVLESLFYTDPYTLENVPLLATSWQITDHSQAWNQAYDQLQRRIMENPQAEAARPDLGEDLKQAIQKLADGQAQDVPRELLVLHPDLPIAVEIAFQLRRGVLFSDGTPMTADDVLFTFEWTMNPAVNAPRARAYYQKIRSVEKLGDYEVVFKFREPYFESLELAGGLQVMPRHFYSQYTPEQFNEHPGLLLGSGPYRLRNPSGWRPGNQIEVVRNERYWGEPTTFDRIVWHQVEADAASMTMFKNGEVDLFGAQPEQYRLLMKDAELLKRARNFEYESPISGYVYIAWNQKRGGKPTRFADRRVRQAMTMLTDRQRIIDELFLGYGRVASGPFSPQSRQNHPSVSPWPFDIERAKTLLKEAGYEDRNGDGVLESPGGEPFRFRLSYPSGNELYQRVVLLLKDTYARAGVALEPDPQDWPIIIKRLDTRDFDAISLGWTGGIETDIYQMFHSDQVKDQGDNFMSYINPELDRLISLARSTIDEAARMPLWQEAHRILHEDQPYTFLFNRTSLVFIDRRIHNVERTRLGLNFVQRYVMPVVWFVPADQQKWSR